jgi:CelD/BcsL family acetyltransferase involved in cellulose biosynthesis
VQQRKAFLTDAAGFTAHPMMAAVARGGLGANIAARPFARCEVLDDLEAVRAAWAELEASGRASPYQRYAFVAAWLRTTGRARAIEPMIVVARDETGRVNAVLPLGRSRRGPIWVAEFLGGADANFKMGLFRQGLDPSGEAIMDLLRRAARMTAPRVDLFWLTHQPYSWQGFNNPMAALPAQLSPSFGHKSGLTKDFETWLRSHHSKDARRKLRQKYRYLNEIATISYVMAQDQASARTILASFLTQKEARTRALGFSNPYREQHTARFFDIAAIDNIAQGAQVLELHALKSGARIVATLGGVAQNDRFCGMFISYDADPEIARCSPGQLLILEAVRNLSARGFATFDLGVGEARYKDANCEADEPLFDAAIAVTPLGYIAGAAALLQRRVKRWVKHTPWARGLAVGLKRRAYALRGNRTQMRDRAP